MMASLSRVLAIWFGCSLVVAQQCPLQFDGRIPRDFVPTDFDVQNDFFNPDYVKGKDLLFSKIIEKSNETTLFDTHSTPIRLAIDDSSIFAPSADNVQVGFRRAELLPASNDGADPSTTGIKTLHFSLAKELSQPLNVSHEYQLVFLESADYSTNQFVLKTGTILGRDTPEPDTLQVFGNVNDGVLIFSTPFDGDVVHNFALRLDFDALTMQVFYSQDQEPLSAVTEPVTNNIAGQGQYHFGLLKKPTGSTGDITKEGFQPSGIHEAILIGGVFLEDSIDECISLGPTAMPKFIASRGRPQIRRFRPDTRSLRVTRHL